MLIKTKFTLKRIKFRIYVFELVKKGRQGDNRRGGGRLDSEEERDVAKKQITLSLENILFLLSQRYIRLVIFWIIFCFFIYRKPSPIRPWGYLRKSVKVFYFYEILIFERNKRNFFQISPGLMDEGLLYGIIYLQNYWCG